MEYYGNALCVSYDDLVGGGIMTASNLQKMAQRGKLTVVRTAGGKGNCALVAVDSLPEKYKAEVRKLYPEGNRSATQRPTRSFSTKRTLALNCLRKRCWSTPSTQVF